MSNRLNSPNTRFLERPNFLGPVVRRSSHSQAKTLAKKKPRHRNPTLGNPTSLGLFVPPKRKLTCSAGLLIGRRWRQCRALISFSLHRFIPKSTLLADSKSSGKQPGGCPRFTCADSLARAGPALRLRDQVLGPSARF